MEKEAGNNMNKNKETGPQLSIVIIAKNEEKLIDDCLKSVSYLNNHTLNIRVVVIDDNSTDKTVSIAKKHNSDVVKFHGNTFSEKRNRGLKEVKDWVLYLDADERLTTKLANEIADIIKNPDSLGAYAIPRKNTIFGKVMTHGGWYPDYVKRLFRKDGIKHWFGDLHEEPELTGKLGHLNNPMVHFKHDTLSEMIEKTNEWSEVEARLLYKSNHPKMTWWRFFRVMLVEAWYRIIMLQGFLDGPEGVIYGIYQAWSRFVTYSKLWEMQNMENKS